MRTSTNLIIACTVIGGVLVATACGSDESVDDSTQDAGSSGSNGGFADGPTEGSSGSSGSSGCGDTTASPQNCGTCGNACAANKQCVGGACACATYTADCGTGCKPVVSDPNNCGACGKKCVAPQVCTGGGCADNCVLGTTNCGGGCVDQQSDNDNCGGCGTKCGAGKGCVAGVCETAITLGPGPTNCAGGGPPITIGTGAAGDPCAGALATKTFTWALCSCKDVSLSGYALVDGFDSTMGPYVPGKLGAGMGYNEDLVTSSAFDIWGTMWGAGTAGFETNSAASVKFNLHSNGNIKTTAQTFPIDENAYVNGNVDGKFNIAKKLHVPTAATVSDPGLAVGGVVRGPVSVPPPCACEAKDILPIASIVDAHVTKNDNATVMLAPGVLDQPATQTRIDLPCGNYYLSKIQNGNAVTIVTHGKTALYIGGDVINSAPLAILPEAGSELDIVIKGIIKAGAKLRLGAPSYPAATRVYVGGAAETALASDTLLGANLYAPNGLVAWSSATDAYGAVFAGDFKSNSIFRIHYDRAILGTVKNCPGSPTGGDGGSSGGPTGCGSCRDCNNQACINGKCDSCTDSSQCCAPLVCVGGTCLSPVR